MECFGGAKSCNHDDDEERGRNVLVLGGQCFEFDFVLFVLIELIVLFDSRCIFNLLFVFYCEKKEDERG